MKTYPLAPIPSVAGLYVLYHTPTSRLYIGKSVDLQRRFVEWRGVFHRKTGARSLILTDILADTPIEEWEFRIAEEMPGATDAELEAAEQQFIDCAVKRAPGKVLNTMLPLAGRTTSKAVTAPKTTIIWKGVQVSYGVASREIGCTINQLQKRLRKFRARGETKVELENLIDLTKRYRRGT